MELNFETNKGDEMKKIKILNLYAGIGGNRLYWDNIEGIEVEVTAVEYDAAIADAYKSRFPNDTVIVGDAKQYLLDHYKEFDFVWASPSCVPHTQIRLCGVRKGDCLPVYPDMSLYEIIIFLQTYLPKESRWAVENVVPFYQPLITPSAKIDRHLYWSNFKISEIDINKERIHDKTKIRDFHALGLKDTGIKNKIQVVRNQVNYETGKYILECALDKVQHKQGGLF